MYSGLTSGNIPNILDIVPRNAIKAGFTLGRYPKAFNGRLRSHAFFKVSMTRSCWDIIFQNFSLNVVFRYFFSSQIKLQ